MAYFLFIPVAFCFYRVYYIPMNVHVSEEIRKKYPNMEFRGKPKEKNGRLVIEARMDAQDQTFWYSFDEDFFWQSTCEMPEYKLPKL
jgi:hypothetical protein